ncbi:MAG: AAA-associated domain-containing protein [Gammaproteobacteria bacterium]|nr:AAA-associated domain-containing protein [Gammaproteobacteria bacterium]
MAVTDKTLISINKITKTFKKSHQELLVLDSIDLKIKEGEILALLGPSGSGKSTLLRIIAGLIRPSSGAVNFKNIPVTAPTPGIAMVFQNFALLPWLTVLGNVELGLEAKGIDKTTRRKLALKAIDTIGLDGYESALPKELSGGMRQRVGIARALVVEPELLMLDEAFSALDILTAENLRTDIIDLWFEKQSRTKSLLLVTHNVEEAVLMADRVIIFDNNPGRIKTEITIDLKQPRNIQNPLVAKLIDQIYLAMTAKPKRSHLPTGSVNFFQERAIPISYRLPDAEETELMGLIETLALNYAGRSCDLPELADDLYMNIDDLFPLIEIVEILRFALVDNNTITPTKAGIRFAEADILEKKMLFATHLLSHVSLARYIRSQLDADSAHVISQNIILEKLAETLSEEEAQRVLTTVISWARYAELFAFDYKTGLLSLENPK